MTGGSNLQPPSEGPMVWRHRRRWELYSQIKTNIPHAQTQTRRGDASTNLPPLWIPAFAGMTEVVQNPPHARRDQCKTLPLDDQGGIKGGLDRVWRVGNRESLLCRASRASLAAHKREVLEVLQGSLLCRGRPLRQQGRGGQANQTIAANSNDQHPQITAHHSNHKNLPRARTGTTVQTTSCVTPFNSPLIIKGEGFAQGWTFRPLKRRHSPE